ncbi:hypothetical protein FHX57_006793 [Paraburkholderia tropica]|uniref:hypothetical protein n=1 Tax=Paraburkholderia tropica TaxID=92647 RepID=UPI0016091B29|nr:hypothetical protein [Paraburkholderia tropica]MBB3004411.1 hypothetical protein [Paraburkholderia tropica]
MSQPTIVPALEKFIATRDKRNTKYDCLRSGDRLAGTFKELIEKGSVTMGGRTTCGSYLDPTWATFCMWNEIIAKAQRLGYRIEVTSVKHGNKSPTTSGGFWNENVYTMQEAT